MRINSGLVWSIGVGIILSAVAWGKTQADVNWMKESIARIEANQTTLANSLRTGGK